MNNLFKIMVILFVFFLLALPLTGCDNPPWDAGMVLVLKVDTPKDGITVNTSTVTVSGRVNGTQRAHAKVRVNDADVPVVNGKYSSNVTLTEGKNVINIVAAFGEAKPNQQLTVTYVPTKQ